MDRRTHRLTVPARAAFELGSLERVLGNVAEQLGHPVCLSGDMCTVVAGAGGTDMAAREPAAV